MIEPGTDFPASAGTANRARVRGGGRIERFDPDAVGSVGDEALIEIAALEDLVDRGAPLLLRGRGEGVHEGQVCH